MLHSKTGGYASRRGAPVRPNVDTKSSAKLPGEATSTSINLHPQRVRRTHDSAPRRGQVRGTCREGPIVVAAHPVAVIGGDGRLRPGLVKAPKVTVFKSPRDGGNGDARRLEAALRKGSFGTLIVLTRWNSHSTTRKLRRLCKRLGVDIVMMQ